MIHPWTKVAQIATSVYKVLIWLDRVSEGLDDYLGSGKESDLVEEIV